MIFVHGWTDIGVGLTEYAEQNGFTPSIEYFLTQGYTKADLYITTYGVGYPKYSICYFSKDFLTYLRAFMEAVLAYTGAAKVDVISHSMGVTLSRAIIKGGIIKDAKRPFDLGPSLASKVDTYIGIAGGNYGI